MVHTIKQTPQKGDKIYIHYDSQIVLRTIISVTDHIIVWRYGWTLLSSVVENTNKKSKVKFIHKHY